MFGLKPSGLNADYTQNYAVFDQIKAKNRLSTESRDIAKLFGVKGFFLQIYHATANETFTSYP